MCSCFPFPDLGIEGLDFSEGMEAILDFIQPHNLIMVLNNMRLRM